MIKNPVQVRLEKLAIWQQRAFMACLCERMSINFALYCQIADNDNAKVYKRILDLVWESLLVKKAKINFDLQLEKLEDIIPTINDDSPYMIHPAIDACQALSELLHSYLTDDVTEHSARVSAISAMTIAEFEMTKSDQLLSEEEQKQLPEVIDEFDLQWEIFRLLRDETEHNIDLIKGLRDDIRETETSNIGAFLTN